MGEDFCAVYKRDVEEYAEFVLKMMQNKAESSRYVAIFFVDDVLKQISKLMYGK